MAITMMTSVENAGQPNVETVHNYPGHETGLVRHGGECPHYASQFDKSGVLQPDCPKGGCWVTQPLYMATTHVGLVLSTGEMNGHDDSDFYAVVWNPDKGAPERITYATTRGWTYPNGASVDATPEVLAAYAAYQEGLRNAAAARRADAKLKTPEKGDRVRVTAGRKVPRGFEGVVTWFGEDSFYRGDRYTTAMQRAILGGDTLFYVQQGKYRVGISVNGGKAVFTNAKNVTVIEKAATRG